MEISIRHDLAELRRTLRITQQEIERALPTALNRTGRQMETAGVRLVSKRMGVRQQSVRARIIRTLARKARPYFRFDAFGKKVNIASFGGTRKTKRGVSSNAFGKRRVYPRTFLNKSGTTAFKRIGKRRLPIRPIFGPGIKREFDRNRPAIEQVARERFRPNMIDALRAATRGFIK